MTISKQIQYGILLTLYISRGGRVTISSAVEGLGLTRYRLNRVAAALKNSGVLRAIKGRTGGLELIGSPSVLDVMNALEPYKLMSPRQKLKYSFGNQEHRAFSMLVSKMELALAPVLKKTVRTVMADLVDCEMKHMKGLTQGVNQ